MDSQWIQIRIIMDHPIFASENSPRTKTQGDKHERAATPESFPSTWSKAIFGFAPQRFKNATDAEMFWQIKASKFKFTQYVSVPYSVTFLICLPNFVCIDVDMLQMYGNLHVSAALVTLVVFDPPVG